MTSRKAYEACAAQRITLFHYGKMHARTQLCERAANSMDLEGIPDRSPIGQELGRKSAIHRASGLYQQMLFLTKWITVTITVNLRNAGVVLWKWSTISLEAHRDAYDQARGFSRSYQSSAIYLEFVKYILAKQQLATWSRQVGNISKNAILATCWIGSYDYSLMFTGLLQALWFD